MWLHVLHGSGGRHFHRRPVLELVLGLPVRSGREGIREAHFCSRTCCFAAPRTSVPLGNKLWCHVVVQAVDCRFDIRAQYRTLPFDDDSDSDGRASDDDSDSQE